MTLFNIRSHFPIYNNNIFATYNFHQSNKLINNNNNNNNLTLNYLYDKSIINLKKYYNTFKTQKYRRKKHFVNNNFFFHF